MGDVVNIASKSKSSKSWTAEQMLEELLSEIRAGKIKPDSMMVMFFETTSEGRQRPNRWFQNMDAVDEIALHVLGQQMALDSWRGHE